MKKKYIVITVVTFVVFLVLTFVLPDQIPLHVGVTGTGPAVNKYCILLLSPVPALLYWAVVKKYRR